MGQFRFPYLILFLVGSFLCQNLYSQDKNKDIVLFNSEFFEKEEVLDITLEFNLKKLMNEKEKEEYLRGVLKFISEDSVELTGNVRIRARGDSRQRLCFLPPFWLNIKGSGLVKRKDFAGKKIKVGTNCKGGRLFEEYLLSEYLVYKLFNILTENSFKVRLLNITFIDIGRKNKETESLAFMIEPEEALASRIDALEIKTDNLNYRHTDSLAADIMSFFQYMIGNTDFTINGRHNIKLYKYKDHTKPLLIPVPYDFDYAGLINTGYALPAEVLDIETVQERYYLGMCRTDEQYEKIMHLFISKEEEIYKYIDSFEYLNKRERKEIKSYIEKFYKEMNKSNFIESSLRKTCRS